jgi:hypothetical protein
MDNNRVLVGINSQLSFKAGKACVLSGGAFAALNSGRHQRTP